MILAVVDLLIRLT